MNAASLTRRYVRSLDADDLARILDGADHAEPEVARRQRRLTVHPPIPFWEMGVMVVVMVVIGLAVVS